MREDLNSEVQVIASQVFNRSWQFIENDPELAGEDRQQMQDQLAELILVMTRSGERNIIAITNRAIATLRRQHSVRRKQVEEMA
jgi:hypothetical protein